MSPDATILTIRDRVSIEFVRRVLEAMWDCKRGFGNALLAIRVDGDAAEPDYRIDAVMDDETGESTIADLRRGRTHRVLGETAIVAARWSTESTSIGDVAQLLLELRGARNAASPELRARPNKVGS